MTVNDEDVRSSPPLPSVPLLFSRILLRYSGQSTAGNNARTDFRQWTATTATATTTPDKRNGHRVERHWIYSSATATMTMTLVRVNDSSVCVCVGVRRGLKGFVLEGYARARQSPLTTRARVSGSAWRSRWNNNKIYFRIKTNVVQLFNDRLLYWTRPMRRYTGRPPWNGLTISDISRKFPNENENYLQIIRNSNLLAPVESCSYFVYNEYRYKYIYWLLYAYIR